MSEKVRTVSCTWYSINSKMIHRGHSTLTDAISLFDVLFLVHWPFYHAQRICHSHRAMLFQRRYCCFILRKNTFKPIKRKYQAQTCAHVKKTVLPVEQLSRSCISAYIGRSPCGKFARRPILCTAEKE